ncbi:MAG: hypothetical protein FWD08_06975, partial [Alphaproteobacteria bacterium]|nr:hypothetical protein [Alphaproteobacteria bacterium]
MSNFSPLEPAATQQPANEASARKAQAGAARQGPGAPGPAKKKHKARVEHKIPGRIRMRIPHAKNDPAILETYQRTFSAIPGVKAVEAKPTSGSIVINYDPAREAEFEERLRAHSAGQNLALVRPGDEVDAIANKIQAEAEFLAQRSELAKSTVEFCKKLDLELKVISGNTIDLKIVLAAGLAAYTFWEIGA